MTTKELHIIAMSKSTSSPNNYALILENSESKLRIPVIIGAFEAQSIAVFYEKMKISRPLTYDLVNTILKKLHATLKEVIIHALIDDVLHTWLVLIDQNKEEIKIDARISDAIAIAIRSNSPIYIYDNILEDVSIAESENQLSLLKGSLANYSNNALEDLLESLLKKEDYESASRIRDLLERRKKK